ncbi:MAG: 7-cyano-7-deazaguanine synthase QueC [bacterium]
MKPNSIILLSGGLDSTVSAAIAVKKTNPLFALTIDYGQRSAKMEILASKRICKALKIKHKIIKLSFLKEFKNCSLITNYQSPVTLARIWVPNRNALFINIAACFAEYYNADLIVTGFNLEEAREFPDNTKNFINAINKSLQFSTLRRIKVISYVANYTKKDIYKLGLKYKAPLKHIYSCYIGGKKMCGKCPSCKKLFEAIRQDSNHPRF